MSTQPEFRTSSASDCLSGGGEIGALMRSMDWSKTPLGAVESWSPALRMMVSLLLANRFPSLLWWGAQHCQLYNDAYRPLLGARHPESLGKPASECDEPFHGDPATFLEDIELELNRNGLLEEAHFTVACSPAPDETAPGRIGGVLATAHEITEKVVGERRMSILHDLSARSAEAKTAEEASSIAAETLARHSKDIPFALLYLIDGDRKRARLAGTAGVAMGEAESPLVIDFDDATHGELLKTRPAVVLPIRSNLAPQPSGLLILGASSHLRFDNGYRDFFELIASQVSSAIANARAYEEERKRAEALAEIDRMRREAREKERLIEQIADLTAIVIHVFDVVTERDTYISRDVVTLLGYTSDEIAQMKDPFSTLWHPDDIPHYQDIRARMKTLADGEVFEMEYRIRRRDGEWCWLASRTTPFLRSEQGEVRQVVTATLDVTARKHRDTTLRASDERFRRYFELGLIGMAITLPAQGSIEVNDEICKILGYERNELLGMTWAELTHPDDLAADVANFERVMAGEFDGYSMDKRWIHKDGHVIYTTISVKCLRRQDGAVDSFVAFLQDITARKRAEEALARSHSELERRVTERTAQLAAVNEELKKEIVERQHAEESLREAHNRVEMLLDSVSDNYFSLSKDWRFTYLNKHAQEQMKILGKDPALLIGKVFWEEFPDVPNEEALRRVMSERVAVTDELYYAPWGEWVENRMFPRNDGGLATFQRYITDRKRAEAESEALRDELAAELTAMTRLHELSTRLLASTEFQPLLEEILNAIIALQNADFGNVQLYNPEIGGLEIIAQRGFQPEFLDYFRIVHDDGAACGRAMREGGRIIIEDVQLDPGFAPHRRIAASAGFRAVQSTPLFSRSDEVLGMLSTHFRNPHRPSERELRLTDLYAVHAAELVERKRSEAAILRYQQELQALTARLIEAQELESKFLARELHDVFSQKLAVLGMEMAALARGSAPSSQALGDGLLKFTEQLGALAKDIHRISRQLHPAILDDLGLAAALKNECIAFSEQYGIPTEFFPGDNPQALPEDISLCLYRVAQESLRNIGKHGGAAGVRVALTGSVGEIALAIEDRGQGFDLGTIKGKKGLGLVSMEERVRLVNGTLSIQSKPGKGTCVRVRVPLRQGAT